MEVVREHLASKTLANLGEPRGRNALHLSQQSFECSPLKRAFPHFEGLRSDRRCLAQGVEGRQLRTSGAPKRGLGLVGVVRDRSPSRRAKSPSAFCVVQFPAQAGRMIVAWGDLNHVTVLGPVAHYAPILMVSVRVANQCIEHQVTNERVEAITKARFGEMPKCPLRRGLREDVAHCLHGVLNDSILGFDRIARISLEQQFVSVNQALVGTPACDYSLDEEVPTKNPAKAAQRLQKVDARTRHTDSPRDLAGQLLAPIFARGLPSKLHHHSALSARVEQPELRLRSSELIKAQSLGDFVGEETDSV